jgi:hypothetical protein
MAVSRRAGARRRHRAYGRAQGRGGGAWPTRSTSSCSGDLLPPGRSPADPLGFFDRSLAGHNRQFIMPTSPSSRHPVPGRRPSPVQAMAPTDTGGT